MPTATMVRSGIELAMVVKVAALKNVFDLKEKTVTSTIRAIAMPAYCSGNCCQARLLFADVSRTVFELTAIPRFP